MRQSGSDGGINQPAASREGLTPRRGRYVVNLSTLSLSVVLGMVTVLTPAFARQLNADEARKFVAGKVFAFTCFDGTRGAGRILDDNGAAGDLQISGTGPVQHVRLPGNTLQIRGQAICAAIAGIPFEPCFNIVKKDERSFRGSVSGMEYAYCDFQR